MLFLHTPTSKSTVSNHAIVIIFIALLTIKRKTTKDVRTFEILTSSQQMFGGVQEKTQICPSAGSHFHRAKVSGVQLSLARQPAPK